MSYEALETKIADLEATNQRLNERIINLEASLATSQQQVAQLQMIIDQMPVLVDAIDTEGKIALWNRECERVIGYSAEEMVGNPNALALLYPDPDYLRYLFERWAEVGNNYRDFTWDITCKDGSIRTISWSNISDQFPIPTWRTWAIGIDVTDQYRQATQLRQSEAMLQLVIDNIPQTVFWKDRDLRYLGCNQQFAQDAGLSSPAESVGKTDYEMPWVEKAEVFCTDDRAVIEDNLPRINYEEPVTTADRGQRWLRSSKIPLRRDGQVVGVLGIYEDITEWKQVEEDLRTFKALADHAPEGIMIATNDPLAERHVIYTNTAFTTLMGYDVEEDTILITNLVPPEDRLGLSQISAEVQKHGRWQGRMTYQHKNGKTFPALVSIFLVAGERHSMRTVIVRDITEQTKTERQLRLAQFTLEQAPDSIYWSTQDGTIAYVNNTACANLGYTREELLTMRTFDIDPFFTEDQLALAWNAIKQHGVQIFEGVHRCKDGRDTPVEIMGNFLEFEGQEYACTFARDISERKQQEAERAALQQQVIDAQQAAIRELSTPLIPIADEVVIMPLIGTIDSRRAQQVLEALLEGVAYHQADLVILDITGVHMVDTQVAQALMQAARAVRLLGAQVMLTGIQPQIAQTLVHLGVDLGEIITRGSLQAGIQYALNQDRRYQDNPIMSDDSMLP